MNARIQDKPVYRSVIRAGESHSIGGDTRSLVVTAKSLNTEAIISGDVTKAAVNDDRRQEQQYVCDKKEHPNKLFSKCLSGHNQTIYCVDRTAIMQVHVRLIDVQTKSEVYAEAITRDSKDSACGSSSPKDGHVMLNALKGQILEHIQRKIVPHEAVVDIKLMDSNDGLRTDEARNKFEGAVKFAKAGRMDRACETFADIYDSEKASVSLIYNLGVCEEASGAPWKADEYYRLADRLTDEPNKLLTAALNRNSESLKKTGNLARNRADLMAGAKIESGGSSQKLTKTSTDQAAINSATKMVPQEPMNITPEMLMLEKRTALVIGNSAYKRGALINPVNDAKAVSAQLRKLNFKVIEIEDAGYKRMGLAIEEFGRAIKEGGVALVFYAGHGMQVRGENYLVPIDADIKNESDVPYQTVALGQVLSKLEDAKPRVNIVMLDACRDNPFARSWRSNKGGLATIDAPSGKVIAFATAPGKTAADGTGVNGLYTSHLLKQLGIPNQKIEDVLKNTRKAVAAASNNEQIPWDSSSMTGDFYFKVTAETVRQSKIGKQHIGTSATIENPIEASMSDQAEQMASKARGVNVDESDGQKQRDGSEGISDQSLGGFLNKLKRKVKGAIGN